MKVFLTGGAGYIGTHVLNELLGRGWQACVFDNFSNSTPAALDRVRALAGRDFDVVEGDITDHGGLCAALSAFRPDAVIHLAGLKAVGESVRDPLLYYRNNVYGAMTLLQAMQDTGVARIVFSSSATVYGIPLYIPYDEVHPLAPVNPYGRTKFFIEEIIRDWIAAGNGQSAVLLRYFNPVGAHDSGRIGEDPTGIPDNLMPFVSQVAVGRRSVLDVFGDDYETRDGTGERDYIHVVDLARAHLDALSHAVGHEGCDVFNIGTGRGATVLELVHMFERVTGREIPYRIAPRRDGDIPIMRADPTRAHEVLGWRAERQLDEMCRTAWKWQSDNPEGYR
ncbi:UDP-glucose 4-epimerase GalE [Roseovarius sp. A46]|uniref:UDP-glucose 4-epimerase GalE n=1 Tax=Roseovarius sp. A46 TaxID=2109331 RepID=UPI001012AF74|nr:UDP-glucose 4-epimerase GalE [Roseovarius sp. A46]RXV67057.1 UDP-glucose 4-epimerase GalE [Roseovarius sp. A46]